MHYAFFRFFSQFFQRSRKINIFQNFLLIYMYEDFFKVHWVKNASGMCTLYSTYVYNYNRLESRPAWKCNILFCFVVLNYVHRYLLKKCYPQSSFACKLFIFRRHLFSMSCSKILKRYSNREYWIHRYLNW